MNTGTQDPFLVSSALAWLGNRPAYQWRLIALALLTLLSAVALFQSSIVLDGTRYFWLNDDQMISMRYARNLAEGYGLVWNPGERVEGYSNFWLPNTYYLKVAGIQGRTVLGLQHLTRFVSNYGVVLVLAILGALVAQDRHRWLLIGGLVISVCYVLVVGGDIFPYARFLAHLVPVVLVLALVSILEITHRRAWIQFLLFFTFFLLLSLQVGDYSLNILRPNRDSLEERGTVAGVLIQRFTRPEIKVAVFAAGGVPYFSRRYSIDLLGKSDPYIAHQQARRADWIGHNKFDSEYSLGLEPDLVVFPENYEFVVAQGNLETIMSWNYFAAIVGHPTFRREYLPNPVSVPYLHEHMSVFIRGSSTELARRQLWQEPEISR